MVSKEEINGLSDSLDLARLLLFDRKSLAWRYHDPNTWCKISAPSFLILRKLNYFLILGNKISV